MVAATASRVTATTARNKAMATTRATPHKARVLGSSLPTSMARRIARTLPRGRAHTNPRLMMRTSSQATTPRLRVSMTKVTIPTAVTLPTLPRNNTKDTKIPISHNMDTANSPDMVSTRCRATANSRKDMVHRSMASQELLADLQKAIVA
jgi:hypothetical protein